VGPSDDNTYNVAIQDLSRIAAHLAICLRVFTLPWGAIIQTNGKFFEDQEEFTCDPSKLRLADVVEMWD
jgi:hypothetical protein